MTKIHAKSQAITLRKAGHSYNYIASVVDVSKSTLSAWLADVPYSPNAETIERIGKARAASSAAKSNLKRASIEIARKEAFLEIRDVSKRDLFMLGLGLYIGEGAKSPVTTCFVNSNPGTMSLMVRWFVDALGVPRQNIRLRLHIYPDTDEERSIQYWSTELMISRPQFLRSVVDRRTDKKVEKTAKLPHGTVHLTIHSLGEKRFGVFLARKIMAWSENVLEIT